MRDSFDDNVIVFKNCFIIKHARIDELMNKLFTSAKVCQN